MRKVAWSAFTSVFVLAVANAYALDSLYSRNLSCSRFSAARERQICEALQREMEWTWTGHAIVSPSFRVTFGTARRVYCALSLSGEDTATLVNMIVALERKPDGAMASAQALNGTRFLLFVLGESALLKFPTREKQWDDSTWRIVKNLEAELTLNARDPQMIWQPNHPQYILRDGCR
jgi:hypothetical protein